MRTDVLGVGFDAVTMDEAIFEARALMARRRGAYICTPNPEIVMRCGKDEALRRAVNGADLVVPDGAGVLWAAKTLGRPLPERVPGIDLFTGLLARTNARTYLLGGRPGVAAEAARAIREAFPTAVITGLRDGYFEDDLEVVREIETNAPDIVAVCLGSPKQELWMAAHSGMNAGVMLGLGGTLDVLAGRTKRAPLPWRERGLEWLWRLLREPKRLGRQIRLLGFPPAVYRQRKRECKKAD